MKPVAAIALGLALAFRAPAQEPRVFLLGVDGMDYHIAAEYLEQGDLPNLERLRRRGAFVPLMPTNPAQSPVSWASLITGRQPGGTRIYGFLRPSYENGVVVPRPSMVERDSMDGFTRGLKLLCYLVAFALAGLPLLLMRRSRRLGLFLALFLAAFFVVFIRWLSAILPESVPVPVNRRQGAAIWKEFDDEGIPTVTLGAPCGFPAESLSHGRLLCGLGVPDVMGTFGTAWIWQEDRPGPDEIVTPMGGRRLHLLRRPGSDALEGAEWVGPENPMGSGRLRVPVEVRVLEGGAVRLSYQGRDVDLRAGEFSDFLPVRFTWHEDVPGIAATARVRLLSAQSPVRIYVEPLQPDPRQALRWMPIASPASYGADLAAGGMFETIGWPTATNPLADGLIDEEAFLDDVRGLSERRSRMILREMEARPWRFFFAVLSTPDRVQHIFYSDRDPGHPRHDPEAVARRGDPIRDSYKAVDRLAGEILDRLGERDVLLVASDHGFASFRTAVNLNRWLLDRGYLRLRSDARPEGRSLERDLESDGAFRDVDWSRTRAYHMGLGRIWLNLRGREPAGIVSPAERDALLGEIRDGLLELRHGDREVVKSAAFAKDLYGEDRIAPEESADIIVGFHRGYRISWNACLGGIDEPLFFDNTLPWTGDHCSVDPELVPGVLFGSVPLRAGGSVVDIHPTLRDLLGLSPREVGDGRSLWER